LIEFHVGNLYTRVNKNLATRSELLKIHSILSVRIKGYYFSRKFRRGLWDGYKRFFNLLTCTFYTGLLSRVTASLTFDAIPYQIIDDRQFIPHSNAPLSLNGIDLRHYQIQMINEAVKHGRGIISAPPNAGKTEVACGIIQVLGLPANLFTHRLTLLEQTRARIEKRLGIEVGMIGAGVEDLKDVNVLSVASVYKKLNEPRIKELLKTTPIVISDECLPYKSQILIDANKTMSIGEIVKNPVRFKYVISYNLELKQYEKKKILRYIKIPGHTFWCKIYFDVEGKKFSFNCTKDHKIYVKNKGCIAAEDLQVNDMIIVNSWSYRSQLKHGRVVYVKKVANKIPKYVYNLEVEDNHNFFADNVLVSNCHRISANTWEKTLKACSGAYYRYGLSATALLRDDISNMIVKGLTGDEIVTVTNQDLITLGISAFPSVYLMNIVEPKIPEHFTFDMAYDSGVLFNTNRNELIVSTADRFVKLGKSVFILVWRISHGELLLKMLRERGIDCEFISGGKTEHISDCLCRFDEKSLKCLISSTISDEGLDVPAMDVLIMAVGFKAPLKTIQRVGRGLRKKKEGENVVTIVDFIDWHDKRYLLHHSKDRCREYVNMGIKMYEVVDNDWSKIEER